MDATNWGHAIAMTKELIAINSSVAEGKKKVLECVAKMLSGIKTEIISPAGVDPYLIATIGPDLGQNSFGLILEGHLDTVPPGTMEKPFQPVERLDKLYGRGAADMKGGCAAMVYALKKFSELPEITGRVQLILVTDEETESKGIIDALTNRQIKADLAVIAEPTELAIGIAHKGIEWIEVLIHGRSGHASRPELGINAIEMAGHFIVTAVEYAKHHFPGRSHPVCGLPTMNLGTIEGGEPFPNIVPELCCIKIDRRWTPNEKIEDIWNDVEACLEKCKIEKPGFNGSWKRIGVDEGGIYPPLYFPRENPYYLKISRALERVGQEIDSKSLTYWTEGSLLQLHGIPSLILGPGNIDQAHSANEYAETSQIPKAAQCYFSIMKNTCFSETPK